MTLIYTLSGLILFYFLVSALIGILMIRLFIYPKTFSLDYARKECIENGEFTEEDLTGYELQDFTVESPFGYTLEGVYSKGSRPEKTVILVHGHTWNWMGQVKYFPLYRNRGYNLIAYNHRFHGSSGGEFCSGGYYEKQDLKAVADKARELFPGTKLLGLMGESLGAATVLQSMTEIDNLSFVHADCPYNDLTELFAHQLKLKQIPRLFHKPAIGAGKMYLKKKGGFSLEDVSPRQALCSTRTPVLLIHGREDWYVPTAMSESMKEDRPENTSLVLVPGAVHAKSIQTAPELYAEATETFLEELESENS